MTKLYCDLCQAEITNEADLRIIEFKKDDGSERLARRKVESCAICAEKAYESVMVHAKK